MTLREAVEQVERQVIEAALAQTGGNLSRAAQVLDVTRPTLYHHLAKHWPNGRWPHRRGVGP